MSSSVFAARFDSATFHGLRRPLGAVEKTAGHWNEKNTDKARTEFIAT
jgi:hypothetical protein